MSDGGQEGLACWESIQRRCILDASPWIRIWIETVRLPDGRLVNDFYQLEQPDYVMVLALTNANEVLGIWHYKHGPRNINLGLPAGYVMPSESPTEAAQRELLEETGCTADIWQHLGSYTVDGNRGCGQAHIYLARGLHVVAEPDADDLEEIRLDMMSLEDLEQHLRSGKVATLGAAAAIGLGLLVLREGSCQGAPELAMERNGTRR